MGIVKQLSIILFVTGVLSACGDSEKDAQSAAQKAYTAWQAESDDLDPVQRLKRYDQIIKDVKAVGEQYPKTAYGQAIAAGRPINGISVAAMQQTRDILAPRAACYANPTVDCLRPWSSHPSGSRVSGTAAAPGDAFAEAQQRVCAQGFAAADQALAPFRINKPAYSRELVQVALAAAACHKPTQVVAAIQAYLPTLPAPGNRARMPALMSILATDDLEPAWPAVIKELEAQLQAPGLPKNEAAGIAAGLAVNYAKSGHNNAALAKYRYVTDTLGYQFTPSGKQEFSRQLILHGDADHGLKYIDYPDDRLHQVMALNDAAMWIGNRLKLTAPGLHAPLVAASHTGLAEYMAPVAADEKTRTEAEVAAVEAALDRMAVSADATAIRSYGNSSDGLDDSYGIVALIRQKLGEPDKALADLKKGEDLRNRLLGANGHTDDYFARFQTTIALARGDIDAAATYVKLLNDQDYVELIVEAMARQGEGAKALSLIGDPDIVRQGNRADPCYFCSFLVADLIANSQFDSAQQVIQAIPGGTNIQARYYQQIDDQMAADGDQPGAEAYAKAHGLIQSPGDRLHLLYRLMDAPRIAGDRKRAEPILREMFAIAQQIDQNPTGYPGRWDHYTAEQVAGTAFSAGYTDLGIELYRKATYKDQRPLLAAFTDGMRPGQMTPVLIVAQDNLQGGRLAIVIDAAIRHLEKSQGHKA